MFAIACVGTRAARSVSTNGYAETPDPLRAAVPQFLCYIAVTKRVGERGKNRTFNLL